MAMTVSSQIDSPIPVSWADLGRRYAARGRVHWRTLATFALLGIAGGAMGAFLTTPVYKSGAVFQPAIGQPIQTELAISNPDFFGDLLVSDTVLRRVSRSTFPWRGASVAPASIYGYDAVASPRREDITSRRLRAAIDWDVNPRTGTVQFTVAAATPDLAKALADSLLMTLNDVSVALRRERGAAERRFWNERADEARRDVDAAERLLSTYYTRNPGSGRDRTPRLDEARLSHGVELAQQIYIEMRLREAQVAAQEARSTSAVTVLRDPAVPAGPSRPRPPLAIAGGLLIGLSLGVASLVLRR
jgi:hypothetical protein